tara:strand:- start:632 stop:1174 length:543 start_codon:yes stop_codon:yes gene_type:complete
MKKILFTISMLVIFNIGYSQSFYSNLKATGLTCAMCSYSTQKSLEKLDFIESITPDLEATSFKLEFKDGDFVDFDLIQEKVEDAGFFVGSIEIVFNDNLKAENDKHNLINGNLFHFFSDADMETNVFTLVDKKFIRKSEYKLLSEKTSHACYETGLHTATCCSKHENLKSNKVFHLKSSL